MGQDGCLVLLTSKQNCLSSSATFSNVTEGGSCFHFLKFCAFLITRSSKTSSLGFGVGSCYTTMSLVLLLLCSSEFYLESVSFLSIFFNVRVVKQCILKHSNFAKICIEIFEGCCFLSSQDLTSCI